MDTKELKELTKEWQKRLRLQDWKVESTFVESKSDWAYVGKSAIGATQVSPTNKAAKVFIKKSKDIEKNWLGCRDLEVTLVHELLHLHTDAFESGFTHKKKDKSNFLAVEVMIEMTAIALVEAKRGVRFL